MLERAGTAYVAFGWLEPLGTRVWLHLKAALAWASAHSGVPALVLAAVVLVVGWRVLRRSARFAVEVVMVTLALGVLTHLGWIRW